jgi:hypothetical protein
MTPAIASREGNSRPRPRRGPMGDLRSGATAGAIMVSYTRQTGSSGFRAAEQAVLLDMRGALPPHVA